MKVAMNIGTKVEVRFSKSRRLSGTITRINDDETCDVDLDSGEKENEIPLVLIRNIEPLPKEDAAVETENKISSSNDVLSIGDRVEAKFRGRGSRYYQGTVKNVTPEGKYDIDYDDGDRDRKLSAEHIRKLDGSIEQQRRGIVNSRTKNNSASTISVDRDKNAAKESAVTVKTDDSNPIKHSTFSKGQRVMARYRGRGKRWYRGTIAECLDSKNEYTIHYDDGDRDRSLSAEFIRAIDDNSEVLRVNKTAAVRDFNSGSMEVALGNEEDKRKQPTGQGADAIIDDATKLQLEGTTVELTEATVKEGVVIAPDDISAIVPDAVDGDVSFVVDSGHKTRKKSWTEDAVSGSCTEHQDGQSSANYSSGKGNRLYRGKVVKVKTVHLYEIEYPDSTADTNIPIGALRLPQGCSESDIKVGTFVDVLSWQDRFAAVL